MDAFVRGLSQQALTAFLEREYSQEYMQKHADRSTAFSGEMNRANRVLSQHADKDDGTDFPALKDLWKDKPETWREVEKKSQSNTASMSDITLPIDAILKGVHESYYLRNTYRWVFVLVKDWVEHLSKAQAKHNDTSTITQMKDYISTLSSRDYFKKFVRE